MVENKKTLAQALEGKSEEELGEFFDEHDLSEYEDEMPEVQFEVSKDIRKNPKPKNRILTSPEFTTEDLDNDELLLKNAAHSWVELQSAFQKLGEEIHKANPMQ